jgi:hypothetical protein
VSSAIELVSGDNRPYIRIELKDRDGQLIDVSDQSTTVVVHFRQAGSQTVLATIPCEKLGPGEVRFNFPAPVLDVTAGRYEGEIEIDFDGERHTVYQLLKFKVRAQVA